MRLATELGPKSRGVGHLGLPVHRQRRQRAGRQRRQAAADTGPAVRCRADLRRGQRQHRRHHQEPADLRDRAARQQGTDRSVPEPAGDLEQCSERQQVRSGRGADRSVHRDRRGAALRRGQPEPDRRADPAVWPTSPRFWSTTRWRSRTSCTSRRTRSPTSTTSTTRTAGAVTGAFSLANFSNPVLVHLRPDRRRREHHRTRNGQTVRAIPRPGPAAAELQLPADPDQPLPGPAPNPDNILYTDPKLAPGGAGPGDAPEPPPAVSAYTGAATSRRRRAGERRRAAGVVLARRTTCPPLRRRRCSPAPRFRGRPTVASPDLGSTVDSMLLPATPRAAAPPSAHAPRCPPKGRRHHDSRCAREERSAIGGVVMCVALALTASCAFQGLNSLAAARCGGPGTGRGHLPRRDRRMSLRWSRIRRS